MTGTMRGRKERKKRKSKVNGQQFTLMQCPHTHTANLSIVQEKPRVNMYSTRSQ